MIPLHRLISILEKSIFVTKKLEKTIAFHTSYTWQNSPVLQLGGRYGNTFFEDTWKEFCLLYDLNPDSGDKTE